MAASGPAAAALDLEAQGLSASQAIHSCLEAAAHSANCRDVWQYVAMLRSGFFHSTLHRCSRPQDELVIVCRVFSRVYIAWAGLGMFDLRLAVCLLAKRSNPWNTF